MISQTISDFATLAIASGGWMEMDRIYLQNRILGMIGETEFEEAENRSSSKSSTQLMDELVEVAKNNHIVGESLSEQEIFASQLMDFLTPPPSVVNAFFAQYYAKDPKEATDYFYDLCKTNDYVKTRAIAKNIDFPVETEYGSLEITINLSKPEKDPKQIALEKNTAQGNYPQCQLCMENEGYKGRANFPARTNHRIIRMNLDGESWGFQYSPYAYYNEHCIVLSEKHRPMEITKQTFDRLLKIIEVLPHYFMGSNADLPIVGGSILSHDHYQGGRHTFAMDKAPIEFSFSLNKFPDVTAGVVKWPMSVIRLQSKNKAELARAAHEIFAKWTVYSDEQLDISAYSQDGTLHHTVTPIARKKDDFFEMDIVLRDNNVSKEHPDGIFHPHKDVQHIKKENIGLIEVMGLAILPPRLKTELEEVEKYLLEEENEMASYHKEWADSIKMNHQLIKENVNEVIQKELGQVFKRVLEDAGVFKRDEQGQAGFKRFIDTCLTN
ncbi:MAG: UDP-glucose--hexose-1-phosphate uridylyltransferase [Tetragenococcus halophilus]|uniref:UDP-glucose--hexose-1-phosphate uridylyltransferase n=1 Tax=Tetragenococcus halophilus TaxID=51669 RepID=UPI001031F9D8|nr:UDP-glucose--hexose-1-phosphate uridylyltransferase [Tetragenococcus halophilus]MCF1601904.1 UDP-glucose--hexose-1-phosphate uridylyltransferase [Tetragenococcus halophilus]MCO8291589.1 UDP-glucose--hexose-1-phosphate uridylyltransferase [Tetragenococcus halophilus]MCO8295908.1 UDP-glucose--hexose-1-phosphate uridylyltransferase [Tetragenococcus halophilus]MDN5831780.1 UDP-glucose--hexose-1-phosphate uridylyltransferase [Tetragenococcus halophilus]MDN6141910.1 UDP-glucose--hexose-1-phosphat